jgi:hypothetical protein
MTSTAISAQGATLMVGATGATPTTAVKNIKSYSGFDGEASEIDVTNLDSTSKEYRLGLQDFGSFTAEWNPDYTDAGQNEVRAAQASGAVKSFLLTLPNGNTLAFDGLVKNATSASGGIDATHDGSVSIRITGDVTVTAV